MKVVDSLLPIIALGGAAACDDGGGECTLIGCSDSLSIELARASGALAPGSYDITLDVSGSLVTFVCTIEAQAQLSACDHPERAPSELLVQPVVGTNGVDAIRIAIVGTPTEVVIDVDIDGVQALARTLSPSYVTTRPNGPDCGPVCRSADEAITL